MVQAGSSAAPRSGDHGNSVNVNSQNEHEPLPELRKLLEARSWRQEKKKKKRKDPCGTLQSVLTHNTPVYVHMCELMWPAGMEKEDNGAFSGAWALMNLYINVYKCIQPFI